MNLDQVINQLRAYCPALGGRIAGAADFDVGTETTLAFTSPTGKLIYPAAVVVPLDDDASPNIVSTIETGLIQTVTETIGVIVEFDATADRRGQGGVSQVEAMKYALFAALLNWHIDPGRSSLGIYYAGGSLLAFDRARLFWEFRFSFDALISDGDGFQIDGDPLADVLATVSVDDPVNEAPPIVFDMKVE